MDEETEEGMAEEFPEEDTQPINEETEDYYDNEEEGEEPEELVSPEEEVRGRKKRRKGYHDHHGEDSERRESRKRRWRDENEERHRSRQRSGEVGYEFSERRRSGEHSDFETEGRSHRKRRSEDREGKSSRRKHHKHRREKSRKSKSRLDDSRSSQEMEQEEGELEDGEIDEEEDNDEQEHFIDDGHDDIHHDSRKKYERENSDGNYKMEGNYEEEEDGDSSEEHNQDMWKGRNHGNRDHQKENKRGSRGRGRRDDRRGGKMGRGGRKSQGRYHDYDNVEDDQPWMSSKTKRSGKQRSPVGNHRHGDKYDRRGERFEEGPFESPPGPYDSPSDEESVDEYGERRGKTKKSQSMLSMLGDDMLDPNIAVEEGQDLYKRKVKNKRKNNEQGGGGRQDNRDRNRGERGDRGFKRKQNKEYMEEYSDQPKKKPLLQTPMEERPICRFFKEGKCQKGYDCPFNHDTVPDKKPELCKYYLNSYCSKGENCIFMHSEYPCKFYHTGQECYGGDDCKFSHDPLTDETRHLIEKNVEVEDRQQAKRPSLLGSPPRHLKMDPEMQERIKKIPSIFDIEVFPPGQSPKKPPNQQGQLGPPPPNRMQGPPPQNMMGPPQRPAGFYTEMNQGRMPRPGMMGPPVSGQGPMSMPPPMHMGPPPGPMGPPGPMNQGPPMGPPRGPMAPGPMNQMNPAMNPAVALVGALLQHAAGARPPLRVPNAGQQGPMQGLSMPPPMTQGPQATPEGYGPNLFQENPMGAQQFENNDNSENQEQDSKDGGSGSNNQQEVVNEESKPSVDPNQAKLAKMGLEPTSLNYLPSKQKELFLRINKTVGEENSLQEGSIQSIKSKTEDQVSQDREEKDDADDNWYSSDEEDATGKDVKPKLTDILKNLNKQTSTPESPQITTPPNTSSTLNIMQMINAIKTGAGTGSATSPISSPTSMPRDPRQRNDPRTGRSGGPAVIPTEGPEVKVEPTTFINSYEGDIAVYRLVPVAKNPDSKLPPKGLDLTDAQFKNDPRVQKMLKQTEATKGQTFETNAESVKNSVKDSSKLTDPRSNAERPTDPRSSNTGSADRPSDPRMKGSSDPRIQKTVSDTGVSKPHDPRLSRAQSSPLTSGASATDPRMGRHAAVATMQDPRMLGRQISRDGNSDPRIGRQLSNQTNSSYENLIVNQTGDSKAVDPRFSSQSSGSSDPRQQNRQNLSLDPRTKQNSLSDPRPRVQVDPKLDLLADPRMKPDMDISSLKPLDPKIIQSSLEENADAIASQLSVPTDSMENDNLSSSTIDGGDKPKLDYRNDPRFKRKPAGKRKSSMDYASPLGDEGNQENSSPSYSAYARAPINKQSKPELKSRSDPRLANSIVESTSVANDSSLPPQSTEQLNLLNLPLPELPPFIPPPEPEINTKDFFKTMDPTASPFC